MSNLKSQINQLKKDLEFYDKRFTILILDNGKELRIGPNDMIKALCSLGTDNEHHIVEAIKEYQIIAYTGTGNMPQLLKSLVDSMKPYRRE